MIIFFFSSRRRHTRCGRDWSSDVCSSDLRSAAGAALVEAPTVREESMSLHERIAKQSGGPEPDALAAPAAAREPDGAAPADRSEERRVGKECRYRWCEGA